MTGYEEQLLTRAEMLEDTEDLAQEISEILAGAQAAGVDPAAVTSLASAARTLDPGASTSYDAGSKQDRQGGGGYESDAAMLEAVNEAEDDVRERLREVQQLRERVLAALDAAHEALAADLLDPLAARLRQALDRLQAVPQDLGEVYELVYEFIRKGGKLPAFARWIEGEGTRA